MAENTSSTQLYFCKAFFVFSFSSYVLRLIYTPIYFKQLGLSPFYAGLIVGTGPFVRAFGGLFFCYVADKANLRKTIFLLALLANCATPFLSTLPRPDKQSCPIPKQNFSIFEIHLRFNSTPKMQQLAGNLSMTKTISLNEIQNSNPKLLINHGIRLISKKGRTFNRDFSAEDKLKIQVKISKGQDKINRNTSSSLRRSSELWTQPRLYPLTPYKSVNENAFFSFEKRPKRGTNYPRIKLNSLKDDQKIPDQNKTLYQPVDGRLNRTLEVSSGRKNVKNQTDEDQITTQNGSVVVRGMSKLVLLLLVISVVGDFIGGPARNLADTASMFALGDNKSKYGLVRFWGNFGQMIIIPSVSLVAYFNKTMICGSPQDDYRIALYLLAGAMAIACLIGITLKFPSSKATEEEKNVGGRNQETVKDLVTPLRNWSMLVIALFYGIFYSAFTSFMFWYIIDMKTSMATIIVAVAQSLRNLSALATFMASPWIIKTIGTTNSLNLALVFYMIAFLTFSFMQNPWMAILPEIFQYVAFALSMTVNVSHFGEVAPKHLAATAQGLLQFMYSGIGQGLGPIIGGYIMVHVGGFFTFLIFAGISCVVLVFSIIVQLILKYKTKKAKEYRSVATEDFE